MNSKEKYSKISLIHKHSNIPDVWWNDCIIYELPFPSSESDLQLFAKSCHDLVQLGINAILIRPSKIDFNNSKDFIKDFIDIFHRVGLKVIMQLSGPSHVNDNTEKFSSPYIGFEISSTEVLNRAKTAIENGVDGIDLGLILEENMRSQTTIDSVRFNRLMTRLKKIISCSNKQILISATTSNQRENIEYHIKNNFIDMLRTDNFVHAPFSAKAFLNKIREVYEVSDSINYPYSWHYQIHDSLNKNYPNSTSWSKTSDNIKNRISSLQLLFLALPGSTYIDYYDELSLDTLWKSKPFCQTYEHAQLIFSDQKSMQYSPWKSYKKALLVRTQHNMGLGTLANIEGFPWANDDTLVLVCEHIYVITNMSSEQIIIPNDFELLVASRTSLEKQYHENNDSYKKQETILPPETTAWFIRKE